MFEFIVSCNGRARGGFQGAVPVSQPAPLKSLYVTKKQVEN